MTKTNDMDDANQVVKQIREGNKLGIKTFLANGGDPITRNHMGFTVLHLAALEGQAEIAEMLLNAGATVNCCTTEMCTPLHLASARGNIKIVDILVKNGAYINAQDKAGNTPLHEAAKGFHTSTVKFLIEKKADRTKLNKKNQTFIDMIGQQMMPTVETGDIDVLIEWLNWGLNANTFGNLNWSILHHASARGQINIASLLIERGADVNAVDSNRGTPLHAASAHGFQKIADVLLASGANINAQDQRGNTPLHSAISGAHPEIINLLLEKGCDTSIPNKEGQIFTHLVNEFLVEAVEKRRIAHVISLLKGRADPDTKDAYGSPVLCCASFKGDILMVDALLEAGAKPGICSEDTMKTSLHYASCLGHFFVVKALLDKGAPVNAKDKNGFTPLHEAVREGAEDIATVLIGRGAGLNDQDCDGNTPLHVAARWGQSAIVEMLLEKGALEDVKNKSGMLYSDLALMRAVRTENAGHVVSSLAWGGNPNVQDSKGLTFLHHAVYKSAYEVCYVLLDNGADVNIADNHGRTPLLLAAYRGDRQIMETLLNAGANPNIQDKEGQTPLHWAAEDGSIDTVELLLSRGAHRHFKNKKGLLFTDLLLKHLYFAVRHNDESKVESLLKAGADQSAELKGTGVTPREEAKRRKYYPILRKMVALAPAKPRLKQTKEDFLPLEDVRKLFEDSQDDESSSESSSESEEEYDPDEDAYWRMHNAPIILSAKELFEDEDKSFWENWDEKPVIISAKEAFKEEVEWWKNSSSSSDDSSSDENDFEPIPAFEETKKNWGNVVSAKEFFREDECWWRDAVEDLDKPKVISAKEFFKDEAPWWERSSSEEEEEVSEKDELAIEEDNSQQKNEEEEISVYEDIEESLTDDWETANDSVLSDTGTMYSVSEGEKIMAEELFATKPWWENDSDKLDSHNMDDSSSAEDELSEDKSEGTEIIEESSCLERENFCIRRRILSSTESDASTNIILEDNADNESVDNVFDLESDECLDSSNIDHNEENPGEKSPDSPVLTSPKPESVISRNKNLIHELPTDSPVITDEIMSDNSLTNTLTDNYPLKKNIDNNFNSNLVKIASNKDTEPNFLNEKNLNSGSEQKINQIDKNYLKENTIRGEESVSSNADIKIINKPVSKSGKNTNSALSNQREDNFCENLLQIVLDSDSDLNSANPLNGLNKNNTGNTAADGIIQSPSLKFKIKDFKPVNSDLKPPSIKCVDEKMVTLRKPVLNKMDACLAKVDASLAWLDARMANDSIPEKKKARRNAQPRYSVPSPQNVTLSKGPLQITGSHSIERKEEPDSFQIFRIKIRVPEQNTLKLFDNYIEKDSANLSKPDKLKSSISENALFDAKNNSSYYLTGDSCDTRHKCKSIAKLESINSLEKDNFSNLKFKNKDITEETPHVKSGSLDTLFDCDQQTFQNVVNINKPRQHNDRIDNSEGNNANLKETLDSPKIQKSIEILRMPKNTRENTLRSTKGMQNLSDTEEDGFVPKVTSDDVDCLNQCNQESSVLGGIKTNEHADIADEPDLIYKSQTSLAMSKKNSVVDSERLLEDISASTENVSKESLTKSLNISPINSKCIESKSNLSSIPCPISSSNSDFSLPFTNSCVSDDCSTQNMQETAASSKSAVENKPCKNSSFCAVDDGSSSKTFNLDRCSSPGSISTETNITKADMISKETLTKDNVNFNIKTKLKADTSNFGNIESKIEETNTEPSNSNFLKTADSELLPISVSSAKFTENELQDDINTIQSSDTGKSVFKSSNETQKCKSVKLEKASMPSSDQFHLDQKDESSSNIPNDNLTDVDLTKNLYDEKKPYSATDNPKICQAEQVPDIRTDQVPLNEVNESMNVTEVIENSNTPCQKPKRKAKCRWSAFEPETLTESDDMTLKSLTSLQPNTLLKRSMSDSSLSDISNNEVDIVAHRNTKKDPSEHIDFSFPTNHFDGVPNPGMKPPIPPRRQRDIRQSANIHEKYDNTKLGLRVNDLNNKCLSYNSGQKQNRELGAPIATRLRRKKKDCDVSRDQNLVEGDVCQMPKHACQRVC